MKNGRLTILALGVPVALVAQAPAQAPAPVSLGQRLRAESPAVDRLLAEFHAREAFQKAEALVPASVPAFDKATLNGALMSYFASSDLVRVYYLAGRTAESAGYWEKALEYFIKARDLAKSNAENVKDCFPKFADTLKAGVDVDKKALDENRDRTKELRAKQTLDPGEQQEMDIIKGVEDRVATNEKWVGKCLAYVDAAKKEADAFTAKPDDLDKQIKAQAKELEDYKFKNDKEKWVEGAMSSKAYMASFPDNTTKAYYMFRMNVLDPSNKKVLREIDILQGKTPAPEAKPAKGKKKGK